MNQFNSDYLLLSSYLYTGDESLINPIEISSYKKIGLKLNRLNSFKSQACFDNAKKICDKHNEVEYVEGEVILSCGIPIIHAWNYYGGLYFDITFELFSQEEFTSCKYIPIVKGTVKQLENKGYKFNNVIDLFTQWLNTDEVKSKINNSPYKLLLDL